MKTKFAYPERRDMAFSRYSGLKREDFAEEIRLADSLTEAVLIIAWLCGLLAVLGLMA